ncbi:MAG: SGNH/GDSL hydrolase family protein [Desulfosudaceae bacterium]
METRKNSTILLLLILVFPLAAGTARASDKVVVFGDSLSDNGNVFIQTGLNYPDPEYYYQGRFSNGPVWVEYLADTTRLDADLEDYAYGGARTSGHIPPGLRDQVDFVINSGQPPAAQTLFAIWIGANDYRGGAGNAGDSVANIGQAIEALVDFGAERFLVLNLPDLGASPHYQGTAEAAAVSAYVDSFNAALDELRRDLAQTYPGVAITPVDMHEFEAEVRAAPAQYGFTNVTDTSPNFDIADNFSNAEGYLYWDERHPTTEAHQLIADQIYDQLAVADETLPPETPVARGDDDDNDDDSFCFISSMAGPG